MGMAGHGCALHHEESVHVVVMTEPAKCVQMVLGMKVEAPQNHQLDVSHWNSNPFLPLLIFAALMQSGMQRSVTLEQARMRGGLTLWVLTPLW